MRSEKVVCSLNENFRRSLAVATITATQSQASNKLLYCSLLDVPLSGLWKLRVHVIHGNSAAEVATDLVVAPPQPLLLSYWKLTAAPPVIIILFIINQWLRRRSFN
jgi:hypothetical protein